MAMNVQTDELRAVRKRFLEDFEFWARHCCKIRTKEGTIVPLILNRVQVRFLKSVLDQLAAAGRVRMVVLKARQQGLSTVISAFQYWWLSQHPAQKGLVMAHEAEATNSLFYLYKRAHDNVPPMLRPSTKYNSRNELYFDKLDTVIRVATAGGKGVARGETLQTVHLSEVAFWPVKFAAENFNGMIEAVPEVDNTFVFVESTAQGMTGKFRELWVAAVDGSNGYCPFFSAWYETKEYRKEAPADFQRTPSEEELAVEHGLDNDQLYWRRMKIGEKGAELFRQEYPATADEAFLTTGRPIFDPEYVQERLRDPQQPLKRMMVTLGKVEEHPVGELLVYHDRDQSETYVIGADVGMGIRGGVNGKKDGDPSVAQVLDSKMRQVAVWRGIIHPDAFSDVLVAMGYHFNTAMIAPERNNHGILTCVKLRDSQYPLIYTDVTEGALDDRDTILIGHLTNEKTKPLIIDKLRAFDRDKTIEVNDPTTLREMLTFVVTETGKMEAEHGQHDDTVMALAIASHIHEGRWDPIVVSDEHYASAV
jgi:hypothetical protein